MPNTSLRLTGDKQLLNLLKELPPNVAKRGARKIVTAGATPLVKSTKAGVPTMTKTLKRSITKKIKSTKTGAFAVVGADASVSTVVGKRKLVPSKYFHLIEGGVRAHTQGKGLTKLKNWIKGTGQNPGFAGQHPLQHAVDSMGAESLEIMAKKTAEVIEAEARKLAGGA